MNRGGRRGRGRVRAGSVLARVGALTGVGASALIAGCLDRPVEPIAPRTTSTVALALSSGVNKIDLLLAIDDSASMADKQEILALAVPDLVERLANPRCVDDAGSALDTQPASPADPCPPGADREFAPVLDIHIGIISSSLGGQGAPGCPDGDLTHLETNAPGGGTVGTYEGMGFLAWDPAVEMDPPGESVLDDGSGGGLVPTLADMVEGVGQSGCGFEAQLESWYRFLVDPAPYARLTATGAPDGVDEVVLAQRADFLRPDSLLAILLLTDENDCSAVPSPDSRRLFGPDKLVAPRSECAADPDHPCCMPCDAPLAGTSCPIDETCMEGGAVRRLDDLEDPINLRCFDQKRRFGVEVLQPIGRYVEALRSPTVEGPDGKEVANPLFVAGEDGTIRTPKQVFFAGVVGVPWQDIAKNPLDLADGGFKTVLELEAIDPATGLSGWDLVLGDPSRGVPPADPLMIESVEPRTGVHPITGEGIAPPDSPKGANSINGHEHIAPRASDLQYACTFDLLTERHCTQKNDPSCDCSLWGSETPEDSMNPICQADDGTYSTTQYQARAFPGLRELEVLRGLGEQGIVGSVCPAYLGDDAARPDFGYRPAIAAIIDRLKIVLGGQCLPRSLTPDDQGQVACIVVEARAADGCACEGTRRHVPAEHAGAVDEIVATGLAAENGWNCYCELPQLQGEALAVCQNELDKSPMMGGEPVDGWCYVDATTTPPIGNPELVATCSDNDKRQVRMVGEANVLPGATMFVTCSAEQ